MSSTNHEVFGIFEWTKVFPHNRDMEGPPGSGWKDKGGMYVTNLYVDEVNKDIIVNSGSAGEVKLMKDGDYEGLYLAKFKRPHEHKYPQYGGPPRVVHADLTPWDLIEDTEIGHGSKGYLMFTVYPTNLKPGTRMESIQIIEHVPWSPSSVPEFEDRSGKPQQIAKAKAAVEEVTKDAGMLDDEIPF